MLGDFRRFVLQESLVPAGARVLVAVSGGADSMALLHLLWVLSSEIPFAVEVAHLDHAIRDASAGDAEFVGQVCGKLGLAFHCCRVDVPALASDLGIGMEEAARRARMEFLLDTARRTGCDLVALGHQRGDQAETVLHRMLRGSGGLGLGGMRLKRDIFIRPLLFFGREEIQRYLESQGIAWVEDESNRELVYTRNRIRHCLLPQMRAFNPRVEEGLARLGRRLSLEDDFLRGLSADALAGLLVGERDGVRLDRVGLLALHPALRDRVLRLALERVRGTLRGLEDQHVAAIRELCAGRRPQAELSLPGCWVARRYDRLWVRRECPVEFEGYSLILEGPGRIELPGGGEVRVSLAQGVGRAENPWIAEFDPEVARFPLVVRTFHPGDRIRLLGGGGRRKVKELFSDFRVELELRKRWPLVESGEILWVCGLRHRSGFLGSHAGRPVVRVAFSGLEWMSNDL